MMQDEALAAEIARFDHVLVDEYQDTNILQAEILLKLKPTGEGVTVVGDDAQAIYSFRAATVDNIRSFPKHYENRGQSPITVSLEENYRSTQQILDAANALIGKSLYSRKKLGAKPRYVTVADDEGQAQYVVTRVLEARERGVLLRNQAVLFRASHHSDLLELELVQEHSVREIRRLKFLEAAHVKDMLAVLRWADNPQNRVAAFRALQLLRRWTGGRGARSRASSPTPTRGARCRPDRRISTSPAVPRRGAVAGPGAARARVVPAAPRTHLRRGAGARGRSAAAGEDRRTVRRPRHLPHRDGARSAAGHRRPVGRAVSRRGLPRALHRAFRKGQEWESVHILNVADGNFPSEFSTGRAELIDEERRLLYVAMTRAKSELHVIAPLKYYVAAQSRMGDRHVYGAKSRFMTQAVLACMEPVAWGEAAAPEDGVVSGGRVDVASRLRGMWT